MNIKTPGSQFGYKIFLAAARQETGFVWGEFESCEGHRSPRRRCVDPRLKNRAKRRGVRQPSGALENGECPESRDRRVGLILYGDQCDMIFSNHIHGHSCNARKSISASVFICVHPWL
jgi:hypothetical protein